MTVKIAERGMIRLSDRTMARREFRRSFDRQLPSFSSVALPIMNTEQGLFMPPILYLARLEGIAAKYKAADADLIQRAAGVAWRGHFGQYRKSGDLYFDHVLTVAEIVAGWGMGAEEIAAALCHDLVEDKREVGGQRVTNEYIKEHFGVRVALLVEGVTELGKESEFVGEKPSLVAIYRKWLEYGSQDISIIFLKTADRLHNMRTLEYADAKTHRKKAVETLNVYARIADRLGMWGVKRELEDLAFQYLEPEVYREIEARRRAILEASRDKVAGIIQTLRGSLDGGIEIIEDPRFIYELWQRIEIRNIPLKDLSEIDVWRLNVVVPEGGDCFSVLGRIHARYRPDQTKMRDYINDPRPNKHQFAQTYLIVPGFGLILIHIRDQRMQRNYQLGVLSEASRRTEQGWVVALLEDLKREQLIGPGDFYDMVDKFAKPIIVYTVAGQPIELSPGSTVLDFARKSGKETFLHAEFAAVNGRSADLIQGLQEGDVIDVRTGAGAAPSLEWAPHVHLPEARETLTEHLSKSPNVKILGAALAALGRESRKFFVPPKELIHTILFRSYCESKGRDPDSLLREIGIGQRRVDQTAAELVEFYRSEYRRMIESGQGETEPYYVAIFFAEDRRGISHSIIHPLRELGFNFRDHSPVYHEKLPTSGWRFWRRQDRQRQEKAIPVTMALVVDVLGGMVGEIQRLQVTTVAEMALPPEERYRGNVKVLTKEAYIQLLKHKIERLGK